MDNNNLFIKFSNLSKINNDFLGGNDLRSNEIFAEGGGVSDVIKGLSARKGIVSPQDIINAGVELNKNLGSRAKEFYKQSGIESAKYVQEARKAMGETTNRLNRTTSSGDLGARLTQAKDDFKNKVTKVTNGIVNDNTGNDNSGRARDSGSGSGRGDDKGKGWQGDDKGKGKGWQGDDKGKGWQGDDKGKGKGWQGDGKGWQGNGKGWQGDDKGKGKGEEWQGDGKGKEWHGDNKGKGEGWQGEGWQGDEWHGKGNSQNADQRTYKNLRRQQLNLGRQQLNLGRQQFNLDENDGKCVTNSVFNRKMDDFDYNIKLLIDKNRSIHNKILKKDFIDELNTLLAGYDNHEGSDKLDKIRSLLR